MCGSKRSECLCVQIMDASRVLGTLRAHCDRLEIELKELDADIEEAKMMVIKSERRCQAADSLGWAYLQAMGARGRTGEGGSAPSSCCTQRPALSPLHRCSVQTQIRW